MINHQLMLPADLLKLHLSVKLGKKAAKKDDRTLKLAKYFTAALPPSAPNVNYTKGITSFGMMLNDQLGDCTIAGVGHAIQIFSLNNGTIVTIPDDDILTAYEQWDGYDPQDPSTDQGGVEVDVLNDWRQKGIDGHQLKMYADPDPTNIEHVRKAVELFGVAYIGVSLPISIQGQNKWDVSPAGGANAVPGSWGGHCVIVVGYRTNADGTTDFLIISWGGSYWVTQAFWLYSDPNAGPYIDEVHALISPDWAPSGVSPEGVDMATMLADLQLVAD